MTGHDPTRSPEESHAAVEDARRKLEEARARRGEVEREASRMRWFRTNNGLAEQIWLAMGGRP